MSIPFQEIIDTAIKNGREEREPSKHWNASKIGYCLRGQYLERKGAKPDEEIEPRLLRVFSIGDKIEDWIVELVKKDKEAVVETQTRVESEELDLSGYADLIITYRGEKELYEIKSQHSRSFWYMENQKQGASPHHRMQAWIYLHLLGIDRGNLVYCSKDDLTIAQYSVGRKDNKLKKETLGRLNILNGCWKLGELPPLPEEKSFEARFCQYHQQCLNPK